LKPILDSLYEKYKGRYSSKDPIWVLHRFSDPRDIEIMGLVTASYSYGLVDLINAFTEKLLKRIGNEPYEFTINFQKRKDKKHLKGLYYRFNTEDDLIALFQTLNSIMLAHNTLKKLFLDGYDSRTVNIIPALEKFASYFSVQSGRYNAKVSYYYRYLIPNPVNGSTCKRMNLFLRWMVRKDEIDTGIWSEIHKSKLIMPVDVHVARAAKALGLVKRKSVDLKFAVELTESLKRFDKNDPVKYDFPLCHAGIEKEILSLV
jgi:uncharacterized protein (TIGR02757 family)